MENECKYISVRGLKRLCTFKSNIYISDTHNGKEFLLNMLKSNMIDGMSIFVGSDYLQYFVSSILDKIHNKFITKIRKTFSIIFLCKIFFSISSIKAFFIFYFIRHKRILKNGEK